MTICVAVKVSEGLVLAADSAAAIMGWVGNREGDPGILKTYDHARKLSHIKDYPIGTLSWGTYLIGARSVESIIKEYEYTLPSLIDEQEKRKTLRNRSRKSAETSEDRNPYSYSVREIAEGLFKHIKQFYDAEFSGVPQESLSDLGMLVSGYSSGQFFPEQWLFTIPGSNKPEMIRPDVDGKPDFGANWFGLSDAIVRLHHGRDDHLVAKLADHFKVPAEEIRELTKEFQYPVYFNGMPLQDAIDYATYLVNVAIGRFRFVIGAPLCGGDVDVAVITPNQFTWVNRKSWKANSTFPR